MTTIEKHEQRMGALGKANQVRISAARVGKAVKAGETDVLTLLASPPECLESMPISRIIEWQPGIGPDKRKRVLRGIITDQNIPLKRLGEPTRSAIAAKLRALPQFRHLTV